MHAGNQCSNFTDWRRDAKDIQVPEKYQVKIPSKIKKEVDLYARDLLEQLKKSPLNIRNILLSEPQLTPGRRSAMMVTGLLSRELKYSIF